METILFGFIMMVLSFGTGALGITSTHETKTTRTGLVIMAIGFLLLGLGLLFTQVEGRIMGTVLIGAGLITSGAGFEEKVPKTVQILAGIAMIGIAVWRYLL